MEMVSSAGGLCSPTVTDLARWPGLLRSFLEPASYRVMSEPTVLADGTRVPYGLGLQVREFGAHPAPIPWRSGQRIRQRDRRLPGGRPDGGDTRQHPAAHPGVGGPANESGPERSLRRTNEPVRATPWKRQSRGREKNGDDPQCSKRRDRRHRGRRAGGRGPHRPGGLGRVMAGPGTGCGAADPGHGRAPHAPGDLATDAWARSVRSSSQRVPGHCWR